VHTHHNGRAAQCRDRTGRHALAPRPSNLAAAAHNSTSPTAAAALVCAAPFHGRPRCAAPDPPQAGPPRTPRQAPHANFIASIRTPYKVHLNFPALLTTEVHASLCRDRILAACRERFPDEPLDWERLVDFPHGSLRILGSRKAPHVDTDPDWVAHKSYLPAKLLDGKWRPGRLTEGLLAVASIFPDPAAVAAFERSPLYLDMIYSDMA
jgi:hypothetical protein